MEVRNYRGDLEYLLRRVVEADDSAPCGEPGATHGAISGRVWEGGHHAFPCAFCDPFVGPLGGHPRAAPRAVRSKGAEQSGSVRLLAEGKVFEELYEETRRRTGRHASAIKIESVRSKKPAQGDFCPDRSAALRGTGRAVEQGLERLLASIIPAADTAVSAAAQAPVSNPLPAASPRAYPGP